MISGSSFHRQALSFAIKTPSLCALAAFFLFLPAALAGQVHESDLNISSQAGKMRTQAGGQNTNAASAVGGVNIGDVNVGGK